MNTITGGYPRSRFLGTAAMGIAAAQLTMVAPVKAQSSTSFGPLKYVNAGVLRVGYAEAGPAAGPPVILLHGWPYDIYSFVDVAPLLAAQGYRVLVPYVRGCGATTFLSSATFRNGQQAAAAVDVIAFMDALKIEKAVIGGFDWAGRLPTSLPRTGRSAARPWSQLAATLSGAASPTSSPYRRPPSTSVVPILLRDEARIAGLHQISARFR